MNIYIVTNDSFPNYTKLLIADSTDACLASLNNNNICPTPFKVFAQYTTSSSFDINALHNLIDSINPNIKTIDKKIGNKAVRLFYEISAKDMYNMFNAISALTGTQDNVSICFVNNSTDEPSECVKKETKPKSIQPQMNMAWCMEQKLISPGDIVYIKNRPNELAEVIDAKFVKYNGEKMTFCQYGCKVTGWSSIQIYAHLIVNDDNEVLASKVKKRMVELKNEE